MVLLVGVVQLSRILKHLTKAGPPVQPLAGAGEHSCSGSDGGGATLEQQDHGDAEWSPNFQYDPEELLALRDRAFPPPEGIPQGLRLSFPQTHRHDTVKTSNPFAWWDWGGRREGHKRRRRRRWCRRSPEQQWEATFEDTQHPPMTQTVAVKPSSRSVFSLPAVPPCGPKKLQTDDNARTVIMVRPIRGAPCLDSIGPAHRRLAVVHPPMCPQWEWTEDITAPVPADPFGKPYKCPHCFFPQLECHRFNCWQQQGLTCAPPDCADFMQTDYDQWRRHRFKSAEEFDQWELLQIENLWLTV